MVSPGLEINFFPRSNFAPRPKTLGVNLVQQGAESVFIMKMGQKLKEQIWVSLLMKPTFCLRLNSTARWVA